MKQPVVILPLRCVVSWGPGQGERKSRDKGRSCGGLGWKGNFGEEEGQAQVEVRRGTTLSCCCKGFALSKGELKQAKAMEDLAHQEKTLRETSQTQGLLLGVPSIQGVFLGGLQSGSCQKKMAK